MKHQAKRGKPTYIIVWEFHVAAAKRRKFERAYGPDGVWAKFFRSAPDYRGTELLRDRNKPGRYLTADRWNSRAAYERFRNSNSDQYQAIDERCEALTEREIEIGHYNILPRRQR